MKTKKQFIKQHGEFGKELLKQYDFKHAVEVMEHHYYGEFYNKEEFARSFMWDLSEDFVEYPFAKNILANWCNWEHAAWELFINDEFHAIEIPGDSKIHVFRVF